MEQLRLDEPYRATKLWNEAVQIFRNGIPLKRHRRHIKVYENSFTGIEAVNWLHIALINNPNFTSDVTREKVVQLLRKFLQAGIFENVSSPGSSTFKDNNDIYQMCRRSSFGGTRLVATTFKTFPKSIRENGNYETPSESKEEHPIITKLKTFSEKNPNSYPSSYSKSFNYSKENYASANCCNSDIGNEDLRSVKTKDLYISYPHDTEGFQHEHRYGKLYFDDPQVVQFPAHVANSRSDMVLTDCKSTVPLNRMLQHDQRYSTAEKSQSASQNAHYYRSNVLQECGRVVSRSGVNFKQNQYIQHDISRNQPLTFPVSHPSKPQKHIKLVGVAKQSLTLHNARLINVLNSTENLQNLRPCSDFQQDIKETVIDPCMSNVGCDKQNSLSRDILYSSDYHSDDKEVPYYSANSYSETSNQCQIQNVKDTMYRQEQCSKFNFKHVDSNQVPCSIALNYNVQSKYNSATNQSRYISSKPRTFVKHRSASFREPDVNSQEKCKNCPDTIVCSCEHKLFENSPGESHDLLIAEELKWKIVVIERLAQLLPGINILGALPGDVSGKFISINGNQTEKFNFLAPPQFAGGHQQSNKFGPLPPPHIVAAVNCFLHWPQGFSSEAVNAVINYFTNLKEPLTTFPLYSIIIQAFQYVEKLDAIYKNNEVYAEMPTSQSVENLVLGIASPSSKKQVPIVESMSSTDEDIFINNSRLLSTVLPPNSCFETAFTSDSPITRIVPQRNVDSLHLERNSSKKLFQQNQPILGDLPEDKVVNSLKRNASAPDLNESIKSENPKQGSKLSYSKSLRLKDKSEFKEICKKPVSKTKPEKHSKFSRRKLKKNPATAFDQNKLQHFRNKSGGYVNPALSQSLDDLEIATEELDYNAALETLQKLMQCSKEKKDLCSVSAVSLESPSEYSGSDSGSYYTAVSSSTDSSRPSSQSFRGSVDQLDSGERFWSSVGEDLGVEVLQLLLLFLPCNNRFQLHLLLHFMSQLPQSSIAWDLLQVISTFAPCIIYSKNTTTFNRQLAQRLVHFMVAHSNEILSVPESVRFSFESHQKICHREETNSQLTYCEQVTSQQFEEQKLTSSQFALSELLEQILSDSKMTLKERKKRLKTFKESYPHIYKKRFPDSVAEEKNIKEKSRKVPYFSTLAKLKSLRI